MFVEFRHSFARGNNSNHNHAYKRASECACMCVCVTIYHNNCTLNSVMLNLQDHFVVVVVVK